MVGFAGIGGPPHSQLTHFTTNPAKGGTRHHPVIPKEQLLNCQHGKPFSAAPVV
jgi:hypothetical protein